VTWEVFKMQFLAKYSPNRLRYAKEVELLEFVQRSVSLNEYV